MSFRDHLPSPAFKICIALLPVSLAMYVGSLMMDVAIVENTVTVFGQSNTTATSVRLLQTIRDLYEGGDMALAIIITCFTIVFPLGKYAALGYVMLRSSDPSRSKVTTWIKNLGQWSMGDVYVVAFLVVVLRVNTSESLAHLNVVVQPGLFVFAASVISSMVVSVLLATVRPRD